MRHLELSCEEVSFDYQPKGHLLQRFTLTNPNHTPAYFKFKLTRPRFYLIKPDRGFVEPRQTITVDITLHSEGVSEGESDRIKLFYRFTASKQQPPKDWEKDEIESYNMRLPIVINDLPEEYRRADSGVKNSEVRSLASSKFEGARAVNSTAESSLKEKEAKLQGLRSQVESLRQGRTNKNEGKGLSNVSYLVIAGVGLAIGLLSSIWI